MARAVGVSKSVVGSWRRGTIPGGTTIFKLADFLDVPPRWLATGVGPARDVESEELDPDISLLPLYEISAFSERGKPEPLDRVPVRTDWLLRTARRAQDLWLAEMPSDALQELAREGDTLICQDIATPLVEGRYYIFLLSGHPLVRKVQLRREGLVLQASDPAAEPITFGPGSEDELVPVGRVLAAISLRSV